jgi:4-amino-4-deoxy-L-arabinose transferase-like glycosyltransferase
MNSLSPKKKDVIVRPLFLALAVPVLLLVPFITKAFHIDDTLFLWCARHIQSNPSDFYGFTVAWNDFDMPVARINQNPPLNAYFIALVATFSGLSEVPLHLAFLIPAAALSVGVYSLAEEFCEKPLLAALIGVCTPAFLVSSTNVMCDTLMVALFVWAITLWVLGLQKNRHAYLFVAAMLITLAALTKYFALAGVPLLLVYSRMYKGAWRPWALYLVFPLVIMGGYEWLTYRFYGVGLFSDALSMGIVTRTETRPGFWARIIPGLAFTGGSLASIAFYAPFMWSHRTWLFAASGIPLAAALFVWGSVGTFVLEGPDGPLWWVIIQLAGAAVAGVQILWLALLDLRESKDARSALLFLWILGTFCFVVFLNWTTSARTIFPMVPAAAILVVRRLEKAGWLSDASGVRKSWMPLIPAACLALAITWADFSLANCQRTAARLITTQFRDYPGAVWFKGHWGFQYYMEAAGARYLVDGAVIQGGDILVVPSNSADRSTIEGSGLRREDIIQLISCPWLSTMHWGVGAGFYSDRWGPLPFFFGPVPPERYEIFSVPSSRGAPGGRP